MEYLIKKEENRPQGKSPIKLKEEAKHLLQKYENQQDKSLYLKETRVQDVYKKMDSSIEGFFYQRPYNTFNFNYLLQILAEQKNLLKAQETFEKMKELNLKPNQMTYNMLIKVCAKVQNKDLAEQFYQNAKKSVGINIQIINSLMNLYARAHDPEMCEKLVLEAKDLGMVVDTPTYTTLINAYFKNKNLKKCWEHYYESVASNPEISTDEVLTGLMIEICAHSNDAERAISLYENMEARGFHQNCLPYNAMIKAMASRKEYAQKALEIYQRMKLSSIKPDQDTFIHLMKACQHKGDVQTAYNAIIDMKQEKIPITKYNINQMLRIYAGAVSQDFVVPSLVENYLKDSWHLTQQAIESNCVSVNIIDSLLLVHCNALKKEQIIGLVLPLYDKLGFQKTVYTFENLMQLYRKLDDLAEIKRIGNIMKIENIQESFYTLDCLLSASIKLQDAEQTLYCLKKIQEIDREPRPSLLKVLGESKNLPEDVFKQLIKFDLKFGYAKKHARKPSIKQPTELEMLNSGAIKL